MRTSRLSIGLVLGVLSFAQFGCVTPGPGQSARHPPEDPFRPALHAIAERLESQMYGWGVEPRPLVGDSLLGDMTEPLFADVDPDVAAGRVRALEELELLQVDLVEALGCRFQRRSESPIEYSRRCSGIPPAIGVSLPVKGEEGQLVMVFLAVQMHRVGVGKVYLQLEGESWKVVGIRMDPSSSIR